MLYLIIGWVGCGLTITLLYALEEKFLTLQDAIITLVIWPIFVVLGILMWLYNCTKKLDKIILWEKKR